MFELSVYLSCKLRYKCVHKRHFPSSPNRDIKRTKNRQFCYIQHQLNWIERFNLVSQMANVFKFVVRAFCFWMCGTPNHACRMTKLTWRTVCKTDQLLADENQVQTSQLQEIVQEFIYSNDSCEVPLNCKHETCWQTEAFLWFLWLQRISVLKILSSNHT